MRYLENVLVLFECSWYVWLIRMLSPHTRQGTVFTLHHHFICRFSLPSPLFVTCYISIQYKHWRQTGLNSKGERICKTSGLGIKSEAHVCMILVRCIKTTGAPKYYLHHRYLLKVLFKMSLNLFFAFLNDCSILIKKI